MSKKTCQINVKLDEELHDAVVAMANLKDMSAGEYLRTLALNEFTAILHQKNDELSILLECQERTGNLSNRDNGQ